MDDGLNGGAVAGTQSENIQRREVNKGHENDGPRHKLRQSVLV